MTKKLGLIQVYTGHGKGKTSAAMGLAMRAVGQGFKVYIIQFMKGGSYTGELISIKQFLPNADIVQFGKGCIKDNTQLKLMDFSKFEEKPETWHRENIECGECRHCFANDEEHKVFVQDAVAHAKKVVSSGDYDMVVLDELNCAVNFKMLEIQQALEVVKAKNPATELIITGRNAHIEMIKLADLVTEMKQIKHYFDDGVMARRGIEY